MDKVPEMRELAARLLDLWQEQLTLISQDPEYMRLAQTNLTAWGKFFGDYASAAQPHGTTPPAASSGSSTDGIGLLADRIDQLDQRLQQLERERAAPKPAGKGGRSKRGPSKRPPAKRN